jgi:hypothetical protein
LIPPQDIVFSKKVAEDAKRDDIPDATNDEAAKKGVENCNQMVDNPSATFDAAV